MGVDAVNSFLSKEFMYIVYLILVLVVWYFYKSNVLKRLLRDFWRNKWFFAVTFVVTIGVVLMMTPFTALVYYDEPQYVVSAQNLIEKGNSLICAKRNEFGCQAYYLTPTGIGIFPMYSFFYSQDYNLFSFKISVFNILMHLFGSVILFSIGRELFKKKLISYICAIFALFAPFSLIHSSSPTAIIFANVLFLLSVYGFVLYVNGKQRNRNERVLEGFCELGTIRSEALELNAFKGGLAESDSLKIDAVKRSSAKSDSFEEDLEGFRETKDASEISFFVLFCLILLSTIRVEFIVLLFLSILYFLFDFFKGYSFKYFMRNGFKVIFKKYKARFVLCVFLGFVFYSLIIFFNWYQSSFFTTRGDIPFFDLNDIFYYFTSTPLAFLNLFFALSVFVFVRHCKETLRNRTAQNLFKLLLAIFIFYVCFFSIKSTGQQFRYFIPITSVYILILSAGVVYFFELVFKRVFERIFGSKVNVKWIVFVVVLLICVNFIGYARLEKVNIIDSRRCDRLLFNYALSDEFKELILDISTKDTYFYSTTPFVFGLINVTSYTGNFEIALDHLVQGDDVYYFGNYFKTEFDNDKKFYLNYLDSSVQMCPNYGLALVSIVKRK
ncbi:MAG TPA: hypothetical protein PLX15_04095 [Candidatus Woesearchaeota archaeon]|nr:hypothetical protein [Candidatus Woesearchaeota archaeon]